MLRLFFLGKLRLEVREWLDLTFSGPDRADVAPLRLELGATRPGIGIDRDRKFLGNQFAEVERTVDCLNEFWNSP
jgi:hypothetical protein